MLSAEISSWLREVVTRVPGIREVWLLGSRANGTATAASDWDLLIFGDHTVRQRLLASPDLHRADVDFLLGDPGADGFSRVWGEAGTLSRSSLSWALQSPITATYRSVKWIPDDDNPHGTTGRFDDSRKRAVRVFP